MMAARGVSIMEPTLKGGQFSRVRAVASISARWCSSSASSATSGTMISTSGVTPVSSRTWRAASRMARTCISVTSVCVTPTRQPRWPSIGFSSWCARILRSTSATSLPSSLASVSIASGSLGRNSCSGGSSSRTVTGRPPAAWKMLMKSSVWNRIMCSTASWRSSAVSATSMRRMLIRRSMMRNMCSVRTRPTPLAPSSMARATSGPVSALANTCISRTSSAQLMNSTNVPSIAGGSVSSRPTNTSPVLPSIEIQSPSRTTLPPGAVTTRSAMLTTRSPQPATHGLPQPRATTAACEVMPPREVTMPSDTCMPPTSSALVSWRTRITFLPAATHSSASSAVITT
mmetsp:Transcript_8810/g.27786  ORF Transcript_8810/g.27786 Transcript_8810/m.27786 type:complete len:344 (-) Transcript_8810:1295-2326(-)